MRDKESVTPWKALERFLEVLMGSGDVLEEGALRLSARLIPHRISHPETEISSRNGRRHVSFRMFPLVKNRVALFEHF